MIMKQTTEVEEIRTFPTEEIVFEKAIYTGRTHTTGGRQGTSRSSDGVLDVKLASPGSNKRGTNPEQLFAAGWSACFEGAVRKAAQEKSVNLPADTSVDAEVDLVKLGEEYSLQARLYVNLPGIDEVTGRALVNRAHQICPYSKATRGNIAVAINLI
jgi:lipoyl-dependent peroxiredoxin